MNRLERLENLSAAIDTSGRVRGSQPGGLESRSHPEDLEDFQSIADTVSLVRRLPDGRAPADLEDRILRAAARSTPVDVPAEQALEWLGQGTSRVSWPLPSAPACISSSSTTWPTDPDFAETAELHQAMLQALATWRTRSRRRILAEPHSGRGSACRWAVSARRSRRPSRAHVASVYGRRAVTPGAGCGRGVGTGAERRRSAPPHHAGGLWRRPARCPGRAHRRQTGRRRASRFPAEDTEPLVKVTKAAPRAHAAGPDRARFG